MTAGEMNNDISPINTVIVPRNNGVFMNRIVFMNIHRLNNGYIYVKHSPIIPKQLYLKMSSGTGTSNPSGAHAFTPVFSYSIFSYMCMFCRSLFVILSFFFWPLCCLSFFDLRILITTLVSSNSSWCLLPC